MRDIKMFVSKSSSRYMLDLNFELVQNHSHVMSYWIWAQVGMLQQKKSLNMHQLS
jgi:hypothetical protein